MRTGQKEDSMKIAFSTIGCPSWHFDEIVSTASDLGYDGFEVRGIGGEIYAPKIKQFQSEYRDKTMKKLASLSLDITMLTSGASLAVYQEKEQALKEATEYIALAESLGVPYIRVMCTNRPMPDGGDVDLCKRLYKQILKEAEGTGVLPLIETNGIFCDTRLLRDFIDECGGGVLWDVNHPYRFNGESVETTVNNLENRIRYVHVKDSVVQNGVTRYKMLGYGDIPVKKALCLLKEQGYDGTVSLEWVKRWEPDLEEPGIVFSQFITTVKRYLK